MIKHFKEIKWNKIELEYPGNDKHYHGNEMQIGENTYMYTLMKYEPYFAVYINGQLDQRYSCSSAAVSRILDEKKKYIESLNQKN